MIRFALLGSAGYVAPKHLRAIKDVGGALVASMDKHDCVGVIDQYFPESAFFTEFERFDRHLELLRRKGKSVDYLSICTPNYLHDAHIRFGLRNGMNVICEKPLVLNPWNLESLKEIERESGKKVYCLLQFRNHPAVVQLKKEVEEHLTDNPGYCYEVDIHYVAPRGNWYQYSWKGDDAKSGGVVTNIGIHFFDMVTWIFGNQKGFKLVEKTSKTISGLLELEHALVNWKLSIDPEEKPHKNKAIQKYAPYRMVKVDGKDFDLSYMEKKSLHTLTYRAVLEGRGVGITQCEPVIELINGVRKD